MIYGEYLGYRDYGISSTNTYSSFGCGVEARRVGKLNGGDNWIAVMLSSQEYRHSEAGNLSIRREELSRKSVAKFVNASGENDLV